MTKRETRVINAFINCVKAGEFTPDYAITLIEDNQRYGWLTDEAKEVFYTALDAYEAAQTAPVATPAPAPAASDTEDEQEPTEDEETPTEGTETAIEGEAE